MRIYTLVVVLLFISCRSETAWRSLTVTTETEIKLPSDAIYGNISSFAGLHAAAPDVFISEKVNMSNEINTRLIQLADGTVIIDQLLHSDAEQRNIQYECIETSLPIKNWQNKLSVVPTNQNLNCKLIWSSTLNVQNINRDAIQTKIEGIQESYLFSLQLLGEEMENMLNDPDF